MIHTTVGVYNDGSMKHNGVSSEDLAGHIWYNLNLRPGRAFFVDGYCLHSGYLGDDRCEALKEEISKIKVTENTAPYQEPTRRIYYAFFVRYVKLFNLNHYFYVI